MQRIASKPSRKIGSVRLTSSEAARMSVRKNSAVEKVYSVHHVVFAGGSGGDGCGERAVSVSVRGTGVPAESGARDICMCQSCNGGVDVPGDTAAHVLVCTCVFASRQWAELENGGNTRTEAAFGICTTEHAVPLAWERTEDDIFRPVAKENGT